MNDKDGDKLKLILFGIILVALFGAFFNVPPTLTNRIIQWLVSAFTGAVLSIVAGSFVEAFTGDLLKKIAFNIPIFNFEFSITFFTIATIIVKILLFGL